MAGVADAIHIATYYIGNILLEAQERMPSSSNSNSTYRPAANPRSRPGQGSQSGSSSYVPGNGYANTSTSTYPPPPPAGAQLQTQEIFIPNDLVGCIIGKGGSKINEIRHMSASQIKIMEPGAAGNGATGGANERLVVITGQPANIQIAVQMLYHVCRPLVSACMVPDLSITAPRNREAKATPGPNIGSSSIVAIYL